MGDPASGFQGRLVKSPALDPVGAASELPSQGWGCICDGA